MAQARGSFASVLFLLLVTLTCLWVFSLPVFPSQDGPVHLYYVSVLHHLLDHSPLFSEYFSVRHPIPPYAFQYLSLFLLTEVTGYVMAEKLLICLFIVTFCFGFRFLVTTINERSAVLALCGIPLSLNWMLGMGFLNYCLSLGFSLFALGLWIRFAREQRVVTAAAFGGIIILILFTHPIPLFILLAFVWSHIALLLVQPYFSDRRQESFTAALMRCRRLITLAALSSCSGAYIFLFVSPQKTTENLHHPFLQLGMIRDYVMLHALVLTYGTPGAIAYRFCLYTIVVAAFALCVPGVRRRFRQRELQVSDLLMIGAAVLAIIYPLLPRSINGSDYFADRLVLYIWLFAIAGAAWDLTISRRQQHLLAGTLAAITVISLGVDDSQIRPTANVLMRIETDRLTPPGTRGLFISAPIPPLERPVTFDPYIWSATRYFRRANVVMLNSPWLDLPILPVSPTDKLFTNLFPARILNNPDWFAGEVVNYQKVRDSIVSKLDFLLFIGHSDRDPAVVNNVLQRQWAHPWNCHRTGWYSVCSE